MIDCELPDFYKEKRTKARKDRVCCETRRTIREGEYYWSMSGKWDGRFESYSQSESAYHFARHLNIDVIGDCVFPFGGVGDMMSEYFEEGHPVFAVWEQIKAGEREWSPDDRLESVPRLECFPRHYRLTPRRGRSESDDY